MRGRTGRSEVVVITGASAGLGRAIARAFAREGAWIGLLARGQEGLENARAEVEALGGRALVLPTDVADADQVECAAEVVEREFGPIDVWVNNAMATIFAPFDQVTPAEFKRATEVTYLGVVYGTMAGAIGPLRADGWRRALAWSDRGPSSCACAWPPWTRATRWVMPKRHGEKSGCASGSAA